MAINVVYIAYEFPPLNRIGAMRPFKFSKLLKQLGINPIIFTLATSDYEKVYEHFKNENGLLDQLKNSNLEIHGIPTEKVIGQHKSKIKNFLSHYFDLYRGREDVRWRAHFDSALEQVIATQSIKALIVTAPPFSMLKLASDASKKHKLPLIIDMRDAWSMWNSVPFGSIFHYWLTLRIEKKIFNQAKKIVVTSLQTIEEWKKIHTSVLPEKFIYIPNGYEHAETKIPQTIQVTPTSKPIVISYVGSFYYSPETRENRLKPFYKKRPNRMLHYYPRQQDWLYRSPYFLFQSVKRAIEIMPELEEKIEIKIAGNKEKWFDSMIKESGLRNVQHIGFLPLKDSIRLQKESDFLFITSAKVIGGKENSIAGKTFEYITMGKPIISFSCDGAQKDLLNKTGLAIQFDPDDTEKNAMALIALITKGITLTPDTLFIQSFQMDKLAEQFASEIKSL